MSNINVYRKGAIGLGKRVRQTSGNKVMKWAIIAFVVIGAVKILLTEEYIPEDEIVVGKSKVEK